MSREKAVSRRPFFSAGAHSMQAARFFSAGAHSMSRELEGEHSEKRGTARNAQAHQQAWREGRTNGSGKRLHTLAANNYEGRIVVGAREERERKLAGHHLIGSARTNDNHIGNFVNVNGAIHLNKRNLIAC